MQNKVLISHTTSIPQNYNMNSKHLSIDMTNAAKKCKQNFRLQYLPYKSIYSPHKIQLQSLKLIVIIHKVIYSLQAVLHKIPSCPQGKAATD